MNNKHWLMCLGVSSSLLVAALVGLPGCSDSSSTDDSNAGAAGMNSTPAAGAANVAGSDAVGDAGGSNEPLTQAELCESFCTDEFKTCTGDLQQYDDLADCAAKCNQFARGSVGDTTGNTLDCRIYHLNAAATVSASTHCPHTSADPTAFCVDP